jgi:hypothetical protein
MFELPTAASSSKASVFGDEATGEENRTFGSASVLLGSCLGQKDPQWSVAGVRLTRPGRGFLVHLFIPARYPPWSDAWLGIHHARVSIRYPQGSRACGQPVKPGWRFVSPIKKFRMH